MMIMIAIGFILVIIVWRWRHLAPIMLYYEIGTLMVMGFVPYNQGPMLKYNTFLYMSFIFICLYCESRVQPIVTSLTVALIMLGIHPFVYKVDRSP